MKKFKIKNCFNKFDIEMSYRNTSSTSEELNNKDSVLEIECKYYIIL